jgi:outer membrane autotransporter protein
VIFASSFVEGPEGLAFTTPEFAFLDVGEPTLTADGPNEFRLTLKLTPNMDSLVGFAQTANQRATALAMDTVLASGLEDPDEIGPSFSVLSISQVPGVLDQLAGESLGAFTNPRQANARALAQALSRRFTANEYAAGPVSAGSSRRGRGSDGVRAAAAAGGAGGHRGGWLEAVGLFSDQSGEINASDIRSQSGGLIGGFDAALPGMPRARLGMGFGYTRYSLDGNRGLSAEGNTYQAALYGSYERGRYYLGVAGRYAYTNMETERHIAFEAIDRRAEARTSGDEAGFLLEAGARLGDRTRLAYRPLVRLEYNHLDQAALRETGAGDLSLSADSLSANSWQTTLGVRVSTLFTLDGEFGIEPELRAGWTHSFGDLARPVAARFYAVPGAQPFVTYGAQNDPDHLFVGAGYLMRIGEVPLVGLDYDFYAGDGYHLHVASAQLYLRW